MKNKYPRKANNLRIKMSHLHIHNGNLDYSRDEVKVNSTLACAKKKNKDSEIVKASSGVEVTNLVKLAINVMYILLIGIACLTGYYPIPDIIRLQDYISSFL